MVALRRVVEALRVGGVLACVALVANTVLTQTGLTLFGVDPDVAAEVPPLQTDETPPLVELSRSRDLDIRNVFCPTCRPEEPAVPIADPDAPLDEAPPTRLPLRLVATMDKGTTTSMATLLDVEQHTVGIYRLGEPISDTVTLAAVGPGHVLIRHRGRLERVDFVGAPTTVRPAPETPKASPRQADAPDPYADSINCPDEHTCRVDRKLVEELFANPTALASQLRARPYAPDGRLEGFQIVRVKKGSLPQKLGLERGDTLVELNGQRLGSADQLLTMALKLRRAARVSATIVRDGKRIEKAIEVQ